MYEGDLPDDDADDAIEEKKPVKKRAKKNVDPVEVPAPAE